MTRIVVATDNFNRASLGANWANQNPNWGTVQTSGSTVFTANASNTNNEAIARWVGAGSFTDDQYSEVTIGGLTFLSASFAVGVIVRASADTNGDRDHYFAEVQADSGGPTYTTVLGKVVNGTRTELHSAAVAWADTDKVSLEVEGTTLRVCKNGTALGGSFTQTDASLSTGLPGILANGSAPTGDDCEVGNLSSVPPNPIELDAPLVLTLSGTLTVSGDLQFGSATPPPPAGPAATGGYFPDLGTLRERRLKRKRLDEDEPIAPVKPEATRTEPHTRTIRTSDIVGRVQVPRVGADAASQIAARQRRRRHEDEMLLLM